MCLRLIILMNKPFTNKILTWYDVNGRKDLPWKINPSPYSIWISEVMLQQTQVVTVIPYFLKFMDRFPSIDVLARSQLDEVLGYWSGLGYYARARNIYRASRILYLDNKSIFPNSYDEIIKLPGIGRSTAGAILALAYKKKFSILDGNVKRVLSRYYRVKGTLEKASIQKKLWDLSDINTPTKSIAKYTQGIMDLGATICSRSKPKCNLCPLSINCLARIYHEQDLLPSKKLRQKKKKKDINLVVIIDNEKSILLEKRQERGIWGGLYSFPEIHDGQTCTSWVKEKLGININRIDKLPPIRHSLTHYDLLIKPNKIKLDSRLPETKNDEQLYWHKVPVDNNIGIAKTITSLINNL